MGNNNEFADRIARIKAKSNQSDGRPEPREQMRPGPKPSTSSGGLRRLIWVALPATCVLILAAVIFVGPKTSDGTRSGPFDLKAAIMNNMTDTQKADLRSNPSIEREIAKRNFADPDLARLILSH